jgi:hypothetical protein
MRLGKFFSVLMFAVLTLSAATFAATDTATTNATFVIPSWISLVVTENGNLDFSTISGPGTYAADVDARLRVLSTASWVLSEEILWGSSTIPAGSNQTTIDNVLVRTPDITSGLWGISFINVAYSLVVAEDDLAYMPEGTYQIVVQYTATTE